MNDAPLYVLCVMIGVGVYVIVKAIEAEGLKSRQQIERLFGESSPLDQGDPSLGDRIKWIQWKLNPKPND